MRSGKYNRLVAEPDIFRIRLYQSIIFLSVWFLLSCAEKSEVSGNEDYIKTSTLIFGVGYSMNMAQTDMTSVFYAYRQGVNYRFSRGELKLSLDYSNKIQLLTVENLTNASLKKATENIYVYELPCSASIRLHGEKREKIRTTFRVSKPASYLSKMLARAIMEELEKSHQNKQSGNIYIISLKYGVSEENDLIIDAELLLTEKE